MHRSQMAPSALGSARAAREETFADALYDWMERAPWFAISFVAHLIFYFLLAAIPWERLKQRPEVVLQASLLAPPEEIFDEPVEEPVEELPEDPTDEPVILNSDVIEDAELSDKDSETDSPESPFDAQDFNAVLGIGIGAGGGDGPKGGSRREGAKQVGRGVDRVIQLGLEWLADHQSDDGSWDSDGFESECDSPPPFADGAGSPLHDVGLTGLALLAFLGIGDTANEGPYRDVIRRGVAWLRRQQDRDTGRIGEANASNFIYNHAIATLALCEAQYGAPSPLLRRSAQSAVHYIQRARNPYSAWRYAVPGDNTNDTSVTGWMVFALAAAQDARLDIEVDAFRGSRSWFDEVTDPTSGRTGYKNLGEGSARPAHLADFYRVEDTEALTAVAVLCRVFINKILEDDSVDPEQRAREDDLIARGVELMSVRRPQWSEDGSLNDLYYWYYASYALFQLSDVYPNAWRDWERDLSEALLPSQRAEPPCFAGSWDPIGPWGHEGGRVYSTALSVLCLEVYFRYGKVLGTR